MHREISDQVKHAAVAIAALLPAAFVPSVVTFAWAGFGIGMARCATKPGFYGEAPTVALALRVVRCAKLDLACWALAGALCGLAA
jgi:hypothetical protein